MNAVKLAAERVGTDEVTLQNALNEHRKIQDQFARVRLLEEDIVWKAIKLKDSDVNPSVLEEYVAKVDAALKSLDEVVEFTKNNQ